jgi:hypothetical protein
METVRSPSIEQLSTAVFDNGRRGEPRMGCDCMRCFGYCIIDPTVVLREAAARPAVVAEDA